MAKISSKLCEMRLGLILWERGGNATVQHEGKEERGRICVDLGECKLGPMDPEELPRKLRESCL